MEKSIGVFGLSFSIWSSVLSWQATPFVIYLITGMLYAIWVESGVYLEWDAEPSGWDRVKIALFWPSELYRLMTDPEA